MRNELPLDSPCASIDHSPLLTATSLQGNAMNDWVDWIATHVLWLWLVLLLLAVLAGDLAWQRSARLRRQALASGRRPVVMRPSTGGLLVLAMCSLFAVLVLEVGIDSTSELARFDDALAETLHARLPLPALRAIATITHLGDFATVTAASVLVLAILLLRRQGLLALGWTLALAGIVPIDGGIKRIFHRPRPLQGHGFILEPGWSFPSGHAFGAIVFYGMLAYVLLQLLPPRWHRATIAAAVILTGVIGISRVLLQVHYFSDVLGGYACGLGWLLVCIGITEYLRHRAATVATPAISDMPS